MLSSRDRLLAALFAFQLLAATVFGAVLVHGLRHDRGVPSQVVAEGPGASGVALGSGPSTRAVVPTSGLASGAGGAVSGGGRGGEATAPVSAGGCCQRDVVKPGAPIKIGVLVTQTGSINFAPSAQGTKAYIDRINSAGGVNGHQIQLEIMDDQLDQARGQSAAQRMLADGVLAFGAWNAPNTENQIVPFLERNKIPLIGAYGEYAEYHSQYAYAFTDGYGHFGFQMARYLKGLGVKNPGMVYIDNGEAHANAGLEKGFRDGWKSVGGGDIPNGNFFVEQPTQPTYDDVVTSLQLSQVDGIATILDQTAYNRLQQAQDRHAYRPVHVADPLFPDPAVKKTASNEGTYVVTDIDFLDTGGREVADYVKTVRAEFGASTPVNWVGEVGWLDAKILVEALRTLGSTITRSGLMNAVDTMKPNGFGFTYPLKFGSGAHDMNRCLKFGKITQGKVVQTRDWACDNQPF